MEDKEVQQIRFLLGGTVQTPQVMYLLGMSIVTEHLRVAHDFIVYGTGHFIEKARTNKTDLGRRSALHDAKVLEMEGKESLLLLQGTGLDLILEAYGLGIEADTLRDTFFGHCEHVKSCQNHASK